MSVKLVCLAPRPMATERIIAVPFAGAGPSIFRPWLGHLPDHVELWGVLLPARETAVRMPPLTDWPALKAAVSDLFNDLPPLPTTLFGHSLGALIALECARTAKAKGMIVSRLVVSGRPWPGAGPAEGPMRISLNLDDTSFLDAMRGRYGPLPDSLNHPDIAEMVIPILRADLALLESYTYAEADKLSVPLGVVIGVDDPITTSREPDLWSAETTGPVSVTELSAGHYFIESHAADLVRVMTASP